MTTSCQLLGCRTCREAMWIAQISENERYVRASSMRGVPAFLFAHQGHDLVFDTHENTIEFRDVTQNYEGAETGHGSAIDPNFFI